MVKTVARNRSNTWKEPKSGTKASSFRVLDRLIGLETEYGLQRGDLESESNAGQLFESIREWFASRTPIASAIMDEHRFFVANGGCVGIEPSPSGDMGTGILEGATPECRSPIQLVTYQSVQDRLLAECLFDLDARKSMTWIKNSGDAFGNVYGQHENYELEIARGWRLLAWRIGLVLLLPLLILYRFAAWIWLSTVTMFDRLLVWCAPRTESNASTTRSASIKGRPSPILEPRMVRVAAGGLRYLHWPIAIVLHGLVSAFVLVPHRRFLAGFFASRAVMDGSGHLDRRGRFWLSARAASTTAVIGLGRYWNERPVFGVGHWLQAILVCQSPTLEAWRNLFTPRQRVQVAVGDSTPNPRSQFLRIGATCLVFDLVESRYIDNIPRFKGFISEMHALTTDRSMMRTVSDRQGKNWNAIELQRQYASIARHFLTLSPYSSSEALAIIDQWQATLDNLQESEHDVDCQRWLLGRVDWVSKRWLMDQTGSRDNWAAQKKIDIKYHELSHQGYYHMMIQSLDLSPFISLDELKRAMRLPPLDTPATQRSYWIREFACEHTKLEVDWQSIRWIDERGKHKTIRI